MKGAFLKNRSVLIVARVAGLLSFIALAAVLVAHPVVTFAQVTPNTAQFVKVYGNINQFTVINGHLAMKSETKSTVQSSKKVNASDNDSNDDDEDVNDDDGNGGGNG